MTDRPTRADVARVAGQLAARQPIGPIGPDGHRHIIPALTDDRTGTILDLVASAGGAATILVGGPSTLDLVTVAPSSGGVVSDCPVHEDAEIGMLVELLRQHPDGLSIRRVSRDVLLSMSDQGLTADLTTT